jgi:hypothetical protein
MLPPKNLKVVANVTSKKSVHCCRRGIEGVFNDSADLRNLVDGPIRWIDEADRVRGSVAEVPPVLDHPVAVQAKRKQKPNRSGEEPEQPVDSGFITLHDPLSLVGSFDRITMISR